MGDSNISRIVAFGNLHRVLEHVMGRTKSSEGDTYATLLSAKAYREAAHKGIDPQAYRRDAYTRLCTEILDGMDVQELAGKDQDTADKKCLEAIAGKFNVPENEKLDYGDVYETLVRYMNENTGHNAVQARE